MTTALPTNQSELELYRLLERANLLVYYDTFINQGGDDVHQLCEAGEEEFLEIMSLVGMASKPLHVRRLQKSLQEWVQNPEQFRRPLAETNLKPVGLPQVPVKVEHENLPKIGQPQVLQPPQELQPQVQPQVPQSRVQVPIKQPATVAPSTSRSPQTPSCTSAINLRPSLIKAAKIWGSPPNAEADPDSSSGHSCKICVKPTTNARVRSSKRQKLSSPEPEEEPATSTGTPATLTEAQVRAISEAAANLVKRLPPFKSKTLGSAKPIEKDIMEVIDLDTDDPRKMEGIKKYSAIYGRFDSRRKNPTAMTLHEISVNEAAAHLCIHVPALLTRRDELFPLARQVVKDSGYHYSKGHSKISPMPRSSDNSDFPAIPVTRVDKTKTECQVEDGGADDKGSVKEEEPMEEIDETMFVPTNRGGKQFVFQGYVYRVQYARGLNTYWRCAVIDFCCGRAKIYDDKLARISGTHCHPADEVGIQVSRTVRETKRRAANEWTNLATIYNEEKSKLAGHPDEQEILVKLPAFESIGRSLTCHRRRARGSLTMAIRPPDDLSAIYPDCTSILSAVADSSMSGTPPRNPDTTASDGTATGSDKKVPSRPPSSTSTPSGQEDVALDLPASLQLMPTSEANKLAHGGPGGFSADPSSSTQIRGLPPNFLTDLIRNVTPATCQDPNLQLHSLNPWNYKM